MAALDVVAAVMVRDGRVLAALRPPHKARGGRWELPGGKVEDGETPQGALVREIAEELGVAVRPVSCLATVEHDYGDVVVRLQAWRCEVPAQVRFDVREHTAIRWVDPTAARAMRWASADERLLGDVFSKV